MKEQTELKYNKLTAHSKNKLARIKQTSSQKHASNSNVKAEQAEQENSSKK